jgi:hypothetical protein
VSVLALVLVTSVEVGPVVPVEPPHPVRATRQTRTRTENDRRMRLSQMDTDTIGNKCKLQKAVVRLLSSGCVTMHRDAVRQCSPSVKTMLRCGDAHRDRPAKDGAAVPEIGELLPRDSINAWL